jgi:hypothetical protein
LNFCFSQILEKSTLEEYYPKLKFEEQIKGRLGKVYSMWASLNVPYFKETFHITHNNIEKLPEVRKSFKDACNVRFSTLRNSFLKWSKRNKRNMISKKRKHSTSIMHEVKDKHKKQKKIKAERRTKMSESSSSNSEEYSNSD